MRTQSEDAVHVARTSPGLQHFNTLVPSPYEERLIVVAQGIQFRDAQYPDVEWRIPNYLRQHLPDVDFSSDTEGKYLSHVQGVRFTIRIIVTKDEFKRYLETSGVHVVYDGHARYGRGPCFGDNGATDERWVEVSTANWEQPVPGDDWENGTNPTTGIFRMGYPFIAVPVSEITSHGYTANLLRASETFPPREDCHPDIRPTYNRWRAYTLDELDSSGALRSRVSGTVAADERFWGLRGSLGGDRGTHVVLHAGWDNTASRPMDLGATNVQCRVFCHFGCSTYRHNYRIVRVNKGWEQTGDEHYAYWTSATAQCAHVTCLWLYHVLTYPT